MAVAEFSSNIYEEIIKFIDVVMGGPIQHIDIPLNPTIFNMICALAPWVNGTNDSLTMGLMFQGLFLFS